MKTTRLQQGTREAIDMKVSSVFLAALKDAASGTMKRREADQLYALLGVGRAAEANDVPLLRRAALLLEIRHPGMTTPAAVFHAASRDDIKAIDETLKTHAASTDAQPA